MYIIVGLGNPTREYVGTRHNIGFEAVDAAAAEYGIREMEKKHKAMIGKGVIGREKVVLAKPSTYMNLSGESVRELVDYYKVDSKQGLIVIYDDVALPPGAIRIRGAGSAGGHNGMKSIIARLGHQEFIRIRMGVGEKPAGWDLADYVLGHFNKNEQKIMDESIGKAVEAMSVVLEQGVEAAMNRYN